MKAPDALPNLILASASPRRIDMLRAAGIPHAVHPTDVDEGRQPDESPEQLVLRVSQAKADAAAPRYPGQAILGADTLVVAAGSMLGKPPHEGAARQMLMMLSGGTHVVLTGYHLRLRGTGEDRRIARVVRTEVDVRPLSEDDLDGYLSSDEWRGKAGAYAIQGRFSCFVREIRGSYDSVVGLPLCAVIEDLLAEGLLPKGWPHWRP
jgi:septum formation protein